MEPRITIDEFWFELGRDVYYGMKDENDSKTNRFHSRSNYEIDRLLEEINPRKTGINLAVWCRKCVPGEYYTSLPLTLALVLCGMDELNTFLPGEKEPTGWKYKSFSKNFRDDLEINLNDLKYLMRRRELPLPASLFPTEQGNTEEAIRLNETEYNEAFADFAATSDIEREIAEWEVINPITITEKSLKEEKLKELEERLQDIKSSTSEGTDSMTPTHKVTKDDVEFDGGSGFRSKEDVLISKGEDGAYIFKKQSSSWEVKVPGHASVHLPLTLGMQYICELLRNPDTEISYTSLRNMYSNAEAIKPELAGQRPIKNDCEATSVHKEAHVDEMIDAKAVQQYRSRSSEISGILKANADGTAELTEKNRKKIVEEKRHIDRELKRSTNHKGKPRKQTELKRSYDSVTKAIKRTVKKIDAEIPGFSQSVHIITDSSGCKYVTKNSIGWFI